MANKEADLNADIIVAKDRGESIDLIEPLLIGDGSRHRAALTDLTIELTSLADLVRAMNCYYSNLIEGHDTHPIDIERALKNDYSKDAKKRHAGPEMP
jgi:hypothetical protein